MPRNITYGPPVAGAEIIPLPLAKINSRIDWDEEDHLLQLFVDAATNEIENYIGGPVLEREVVIIEDTAWKNQVIPFEVRELSAVEWVDSLGNVAALPESDYDFFANELTLSGGKPAGFHHIRITCSAGYSIEEIPADIKRAALLIFSSADTYRENMPVKLNTSAQALLRPYRKY